MGVFVAMTAAVGLMVMRYAPGGDGNMTTYLAVSVPFFNKYRNHSSNHGIMRLNI